MRKIPETRFQTRQYMLSKDFELYYYNDHSLSKVELHSHDYYEFYFFLEGDVSIRIGENLFPVKYGDVMLVPPHIPHCPLIHGTGTPYRRFVLWISQEYYRRLKELSPDYVYLMDYVETHQKYLFSNDRITFNSLQSRIIELIEEMNAERFGKDAQISLYVNELVLYLNRLIFERNAPKKKSREMSLYRNLIRYIENHLEQDLSLDLLAKEFFVSKYHIAHVFKDNLGMSIHQYITKKRLALCRDALLGEMSITQIYQTFGFGDYSSFYRAFKKEYGISPRDFKDMQTITYE
ncbi:MAG: AraC family transcriptional regulator [Lachnospiraceae bacterium]|nr:AraC family transcriptional regulator [Lachnospiraceae bacterium]